MRSALSTIRGIIAAVFALACIAPAQTPTHWILALDSGSQATASPVIRVYSPRGVEVGVISNLPGSGPSRALAAAPDGTLWLCRGSRVHQLDAQGNATSLVIDAPAGAGASQDVEVSDDGEIWVSWGNGSPDSRLSHYDQNATLILSRSDPLLLHPRRIAIPWGSAPGTVYVANRTNGELLRYDVAGDSFNLLTDFGTVNVGPVGLCWNEADGSLFVTSSFGQANEIGKVTDLGQPSGTYAQVFDYANAGPGLTAPAGLVHDRFDNLYVASRGQNGGTAGIAILSGGSATPLGYLQSFPLNGASPSSVIDVALQPIDMTLTTPTGTQGEAALFLGQQNALTFHAPLFAGRLYAAALSLSWPSCAPPGPDPFIRLPLPDVRGIPLCADDLFSATAGLISSLPGPGNLFVGVSGFAGTLDPTTGEAVGSVDLTLLPAPSLDGFPITIAWVTLDANLAIDGISLETPLTLRF